jgi:hypothetical protein
VRPQKSASATLSADYEFVINFENALGRLYTRYLSRMSAIDVWLAEANDPTRSWHKRQNTWEIEPWLELLCCTRFGDPVDALLRERGF